MRTTPHTFADLEEPYREPLKQFIREIVDTGFKSGLLYEGMTWYPARTKCGNADDVAARGWSQVRRTGPTRGR